jgi:heat shock protein HslJ
MSKLNRLFRNRFGAACAVLLSLLVVVALAAGWVVLHWSVFPMYRQYMAVAINGDKFDEPRPTLTLIFGWGYRISGFGGCNHWSAAIEFADHNNFTIKTLYQTALACPGKVQAENKFVQALLAARRWRMDGPALILQGDNDVLRFEPASKT